MSYSIIGLGAIGSAIAQAFANKGIEVKVASRRPLKEAAAKIGVSVVATTLEDAVESDVVILAVPFDTVKEVATATGDWKGKIVIDATNAFRVPIEQLNGEPSSAFNAKLFLGGQLVKAFNHLPAGVLAQGASSHGGRRVIFVSADDAAASATVATLVDRLGFAPIQLGRLADGGALVQAKGDTWTQLIFQDLVKFD